MYAPSGPVASRRLSGWSSRGDLSMARTLLAISGDVTDRPSGGSMYAGSILGGSATGLLPVGVAMVAAYPAASNVSKGPTNSSPQKPNSDKMIRIFLDIFV